MNIPDPVEQQRLEIRSNNAIKFANDMEMRALQASEDIAKEKTQYFEKIALANAGTIALVVSFVGAHSSKLQPPWLLRSALVTLFAAMISAMYRNWKYPYYLTAVHTTQALIAMRDREQCRLELFRAGPALSLLRKHLSSQGTSCKILTSMSSLRVKCSKEPLLTVKRSKQWSQTKRMVYILTAKKPLKYPYGRSRIIYIGTTGKGTRRPATSAVDKASEAFGELRGVREIETYIVTSGTRKRVPTWQHLESSLLAVFVGRYHRLPWYNKKRGSIRYAEDVTLFKRKALEQIILRFVA
jgi:hypothetical protein